MSLSLNVIAIDWLISETSRIMISFRTVLDNYFRVR